MSGFARKVRRTQLRQAALADAAGRGCTCARPEVELVRVEGAVFRAAILHDHGCPATGSGSVVVVAQREGERR